MSVKLTSPVLGQGVGYIYTGTMEDWLLASGYAKRDANTAPTSYVGPGTQNTGATDVVPAKDPGLPGNRGDKAHWSQDEDESRTHATIANSVANLNLTSFPNPDKPDFDQGGVEDDAPSDVTLSPVTGPIAGGTIVTIEGDNLVGITSVTFGGTAGTALNVTKAAQGEVKVTTPAKAAGAVNVVLVDTSGNTTITNGFTFTA